MHVLSNTGSAGGGGDAKTGGGGDVSMTGGDLRGDAGPLGVLVGGVLVGGVLGGSNGDIVGTPIEVFFLQRILIAR